MAANGNGKKPPGITDEEIASWHLGEEIRAQHEAEAKYRKSNPLPVFAETAAQVLRSDAFTRPQRTYPTGYQELDNLIGGGAKARQLLTIAAPTGAGKTGFGSSIALDMAITGVPILWVATEIDNAEQAARFASIAYHLTDQRATPDDFLSLRTDAKVAAIILENWPIYLLNLDDPDGNALDIIAERARALTEAHGQPPVIFVDYLQVLAIEDEQKRRMGVTQVSTRLRRMARELDAAIIAISSVSRAYYGKNRKNAADQPEDPIDWLAAAKESGDIEYSSAVFSYLDTSDEVNQLGEAVARLVIAKSRRGQRGFVGLRFHGPSGCFKAAPGSVQAMKPARMPKGPSNLVRVVEFVKQHQVDPPSRRMLRSTIGMRLTHADEAVKLALEEGLLIECERTYTNERGENRAKKVLLVPNDQ